MPNEMKGRYAIHYEEYGGNDYLVDLAPEDIRDFFKWLGYSREKANLILGGIEKLEIVACGFTPLVQDDERFYVWAKEKYRSVAERQFGFDPYILCYYDSDGNYKEHICRNFAEANACFDKCVAQGLSATLHNRTKKGAGWRKHPIREHHRAKAYRKFVMNHIKGRDE